jgi:hypothetical protein
LGQNRRIGNGRNCQSARYAYREDTGRKDQGRALLDEGSATPMIDEDGPTLMDAKAPVVGIEDGTNKTSK